MMLLKKQNHSRKFFLLMFIYFLILYIAIFKRDIYDIGWMIEFIVGVTLFYNNRLKKNISNLLAAILIIVPITIITNSNLIYATIDILTIFNVLSILDVVRHATLTKKHYKIIDTIIFIYIFLFFLFIGNSSFYSAESGRYMGLMPTSSVSSSVLMLIIVYLIEHYKYTSYKKTIFILSIIIVILNIVLCNTRTVLFIFPYILYSFFILSSNKLSKHLIVATIIFISIGAFSFINNNAETLRLSKDESSFLTRAALYETQFEEIKKAKFIFPHGSNACTKYIQVIAGEEYSPHNDFLKYWYDWGIMWFVFLYILFKKIANLGFKGKSHNILCLVLLLLASSSLHNILFSSYMWVALALALVELRSSYNLGK